MSVFLIVVYKQAYSIYQVSSNCKFQKSGQSVSKAALNEQFVFDHFVVRSSNGDTFS
jgi:hypothetical protein